MRMGGVNNASEAAGRERPDRNASEGIEPRNFQRQRGRQCSYTGRQQEQISIWQETVLSFGV